MDGSKLRVEEATISKGRSERGAMRGGMRGPPRSRSPRGGSSFHGSFRGGRDHDSGRGGYSRGPPPRDGRMASPRGYRDVPPMRDSRRSLSPMRGDRGIPMRGSRGPPPRNGMGMGRDRGNYTLYIYHCHD